MLSPPRLLKSSLIYEKSEDVNPPAGVSKVMDMIMTHIDESIEIKNNNDKS